MRYAGLKLGANRVARVEDGACCVIHAPEPHDERDVPFIGSRVMSLRPVVSTEAVDFLVHVEDMGFRVQSSGSCVGYDIAQKVWLAAALSGHPLSAFPSPLAIYTPARLGGDPPKKPGEPLLTDWGCQPRVAMGVVHEIGLCAETRWPDTLENVNVVPPADVYHEASVATIEQYARIASGITASGEMLAALRRGHPPGICIIADEAFVETGKHTYTKPGGRILGGHALTVCAWDPIEQRFGTISTWGRQYGDQGIFWISAEYINSRAYDIWVVMSAPEMVQ